MESLKQRREAFVSDLVGGTTLDIYTVTAVSALSYLAWCIVKRTTDIFDGASNLGLIIDMALNWNNILLATTIYSNNIALLCVLIAIPLCGCVISPKSDKSSSSIKRKVLINFKSLSVKEYLPFKSYITVYRAHMMIITCVCIMAVDFQLFPRRFAKVETWGTSLMDLGVGSFVFSMGLITTRSYLRQFYLGGYSYPKNIIKCVKSCIPIVILGIIRLISVKGVDYHEHVTEYGKHWNFFFTLACMPLFSTLLSPLIIKISPLILSAIIIVSYEYLLTERGVLSYIISAPRIGFFSSNREGLFSLFGYFSIFLNGLAIGSAILPVVPTPNNLFRVSHTKESLAKAYTKGLNSFALSPLSALIIMSVIYQSLYYVIDTCYSYSVSRRTANLLYVIWVSAYNCTFLLIYYLIERFSWGPIEASVITGDEDSEIDVKSDVAAITNLEIVPLTLKAVNSNSLVLFIAANLLTGLINLTYNTLDSSPWTSVGVLWGYILILSGVTLILYKLGIILR